jgi:hypothetical protein
VRKSENCKFGFFFVSAGLKVTQMYFAGFQKGASPENAHQIVIAEVRDDPLTTRKVAYALDPFVVQLLDEQQLENLCRIAVSQFLTKLPVDNFLCHALPLDLATQPWNGIVQPVDLTADCG